MWNAQPGSTFREILWQCGGRSAILTPMMSEGDPIALLIFVREQTARHDWRAFSVFDLPHAQDFGEQAAVAFTNARLYEQLRTAHRRLQELDQMKDQFMGTASHELRTPLTAVQGYIELLSQYDDILPSDERRDFLEKARRGCDELAMLLSNVMDASRLERDVAVRAALLKSVSVKETIENVVLMIEPNLTKERRTLRVEVPDDLSVRADPMRLRQVLMNICANALKYSKPQTPLAITASVQQELASMVTIRVTDRGKGIAPEDQERIFQRFFRLEVDVNSPVRGSGLGLYISKRLIEAMGGKIWIESQGTEGEGSTFAIQLPMAG
jgi:signal transduction histidine kinase